MFLKIKLFSTILFPTWQLKKITFKEFVDFFAVLGPYKEHSFISYT